MYLRWEGSSPAQVSLSGKPVPAVVDEALLPSVLEALKGDGSALHVDEDLLEARAVLGREPPGGVDVESGAPPATELGVEDPRLERE